MLFVMIVAQSLLGCTIFVLMFEVMLMHYLFRFWCNFVFANFVCGAIFVRSSIFVLIKGQSLFWLWCNLYFEFGAILFQGMAAISASLSFFSLGEVRGWASPGVPSLQGFDGLNNSLSYAPLSKEAASWISK